MNFYPHRFRNLKSLLILHLQCLHFACNASNTSMLIIDIIMVGRVYRHIIFTKKLNHSYLKNAFKNTFINLSFDFNVFLDK